MARSPQNLPEGTDTIIPGATADEETDIDFTAEPATSDVSAPAAAPVKAGGGAAPQHEAMTASGLKDDAKRVVGEKAAGLREQAADTARSYLLQGKDKATDAIDNVLRVLDDAAAQVDEKVGEQYGDYVRRLGDTIEGYSSQLRDKDVDELIEDARGLVKSNPALAIGAATAVGFLVARVLKAGLAPPETQGTTATPTEPASA